MRLFDSTMMLFWCLKRPFRLNLRHRIETKQSRRSYHQRRPERVSTNDNIRAEEILNLGLMAAYTSMGNGEHHSLYASCLMTEEGFWVGALCLMTEEGVWVGALCLMKEKGVWVDRSGSWRKFWSPLARNPLHARLPGIALSVLKALPPPHFQIFLP